MKKCFKCSLIKATKRVSSGSVYGNICQSCFKKYEIGSSFRRKTKLKYKIEPCIEYLSELTGNDFKESVKYLLTI